MARKSALVLALMAALSASELQALGLGDIVVRSGLNQPLEADIPLVSAQGVDEEMIRASLASPEAFDRAGVERTYFLSNIRFIPVTLPDGRKVVRLRTKDPVKEPFLNFIVEVNWPAGRMQREYTLLMDPPVFAKSPRPAAVSPARSSGPSARYAPSGPAPAYVGTYSGDSYGPTGSSDTLWGIANKVRGSHATAQAMVALYQANPDAFSSRNMNSLKQGKTLKLPSDASIDAVSMAEARRLMIAHNQAWASRSGVDDGPAPVLEAGQGGAVAAGTTTPSGDGRLKLVSPGGKSESAEGGTGDGALRDRLSSAVEAQETLGKENEELRSQLGQLASQVEKMERLVKLKDEQMTALQSGQAAPETPPELAATAETPAATIGQAGEVTPSPDTATPEVAASPDVPPATTTGEASAPADTAATPAVTPPAPTSAATPAAAKPLQTRPAPAEEALLDQLLANPLWLALGGGGVLIVLLGIMALRRRQAAEEEFRLEPTVAPLKFTPPEPEAGLSADLEIPDIEVETEAEVSGAAETAVPQNFDNIADPLGEADIYIAYGKYAQAEELLKATLAKDSSRHEARVKLLECYAEIRDRNAFESEAEKLRGVADLDSGLRARVAELFESTWHGERFTLFGADRPIAEPELPSADDIFANLDVESEPRLGGARPTEPEVPAGEFSLDEAQEFSGLGSFARNEPQPAAEEKFEFDLTPGAAPVADQGMDFDLEGFDLGKKQPTPPAQPADAGLDFNLDAELAAFDIGATAEPAATRAEEPMDFDLDAELAKPAPSLGGLAAEDEDLLAGSDEAATKLDLARAYIDMGDHDGARDILGEVLLEGNIEQKQAAEALLSKLG